MPTASPGGAACRRAPGQQERLHNPPLRLGQAGCIASKWARRFGRTAGYHRQPLRTSDTPRTLRAATHTSKDLLGAAPKWIPTNNAEFGEAYGGIPACRPRKGFTWPKWTVLHDRDGGEGTAEGVPARVEVLKQRISSLAERA